MTGSAAGLRGPVAKRLAAVFALWIAVAVIYWPSSAALSRIWGGPGEFDHGYLILLVSLWLVVRDRERLVAAPVRPAAGALVLAVALSVAWLWFWRAAIQDLHLILMPLILLVALAAGLGWRISRELLFPVGFLYFGIPVWELATGVLQGLSSKANGMLMWLAGMPAMMQGNFIRLPTGTLRIEGGCSGLHTLVVGLAVAALYGEISSSPPRRRLVWLGLMAVIALITNWIRIFIITVAAYRSALRTSLVSQHVWLGWCLFVVAVICFMWLAGRLDRSMDRRIPAERPARESTLPPRGAGAGLVGVAATVACLGILPGLAYSADLSRFQRQSAIIVDWPAAPVDWRGPQSILSSEWTPLFLSPSVEEMQRYVDARGRPIDAFLVAYRAQTQRAKLMGYWNTVLGAEGALQPQRERVVDTPAGRWRETLVVDSAGSRSLIWWHYRIGGRIFVGARLAQLWYGLTAIASPPVSSLTALRVLCGSADCADAHGRLSAAAAELEPTARM